MGHTLGDTEGYRLRFIFDGAVVSLTLSTDARIQDIARILGGLPRLRHGNPVGIDVTLSKPDLGLRRFSQSISAWPRIVSDQHLAMEQLVLAYMPLEENERADSGYDAR